MGKPYIPIYFDLLRETEYLTDDEFGRMVRGAIAYAEGQLDYQKYIIGNEKYAFPFLVGQIDRNMEIKNKRAFAGATRKQHEEANVIKEEQMITNDSKVEQKNKRFTPPTLEEVTEYCRERNNSIDPAYFIDYHVARNWVLSNGKKMQDWKATIRTWEKNNYNRQKPKAVVAQQYKQRDYSNEQEDAMTRMLELARG